MYIYCLVVFHVFVQSSFVDRRKESKAGRDEGGQTLTQISFWMLHDKDRLIAEPTRGQLPGAPTFESCRLVPGWSPVKKGTLFLSIGQTRAKAFEEALKEFSVLSCAEAVVQVI